MSFDERHYVPVLKLKRGEKDALAVLTPDTCNGVTPLLEVVERKDEKSVAEHLETAFDGIGRAVAGFKRYFLDVRELSPDGPEAARAAFRKTLGPPIPCTPVTGISRTADVEAAFQLGAKGIALRVSRAELEAGGLRRKIEAFLRAASLEPGNVDLIADLGATDDLITEGVAAIGDLMLSEIPDHTLWRTFTLSAASFPDSMRQVASQSSAATERTDWVAWRESRHSLRRQLVRLPTFSDGVIQNPRGVEGFDPRTMDSSACIRYLAGDEWVLVKGRGTKKELPSIQYPGLAAQLVTGPLSEKFYGSKHCKGCEGMRRAAAGRPGLGSQEVWRKLGTIHHITATVEALAELAWP